MTNRPSDHERMICNTFMLFPYEVMSCNASLTEMP